MEAGRLWGLNLNTARYRTLDPQLGRWWQIDPEVEQFEAWSAYNSNLDNPIRYEDKDGDTPGGGDPLDDEQPINIPEGGFCGGGSFSGCNNYGSSEMGVGQFFLGFLKNAAEEAVQTVAIVGDLISDGDVDTETTTNNKGSNLELRAKEIHSTLPKATQSRTTTAVGKVKNSDGSTSIVVGSSENRLRPAQRAVLKKGEQEAKGKGHAEVTVINHAKQNGQQVLKVAASRPICANCAKTIKQNGAKPASSLKKAPVPKTNPTPKKNKQ